jgi:hypothetical protein
MIEQMNYDEINSKNPRDPFTLCLIFKKTVRIMENPTLPTNWLAALSNANHDGTTQQIDDAVGNFETENQVFLQKTCFITEVV